MGEHHKNSGFTLVELSVVIVIIGLIVAGIVAGKSLVEQSKARSIIGDINRYTIAYTMFESIYADLPGDFNNATDYWASHGNVVNGNGNGEVLNEQLQFWRHLSLSGLIEGNYSGVDEGDPDIQIPLNAPKTVINGATWSAWSPNAGLPTSHGYDGTMLYFGGPFTVNVFLPVINTEMAFSIDKKMDDGLVGQGTIHASNGYVTPGAGWGATSGCHTGSNSSTSSEWDFTTKGDHCALIYWIKITQKP